MFPLWLRIFIVSVCLLWTPAVIEAQVLDSLSDEEPDKPWHIEADEVSYDDVLERYLAKGNVTISKRDTKLNADFVQFDHKAMKALAVGNVMMTVGEDVVIGNSIELDLESETGTIYQGSIFLRENHFYIKGDRLEKVGKDSYAAEKATISTCDGEPPAWRITGRNLKVTLEGFATVQHAAVWANRVPVLYTPYLVFPTKRKRQTGFLPPQFGSSKRNGFFYTQPFFWAISENQDATFYWHHMDKRGEKMGVEYRYVLDHRSKGTVMYDFLEDRQIDDGIGDNSANWGFEDDGVLRPNTDRYWFRAKVDQPLPYDIAAKLDLDIVSDQDYLLEFERGETGFEWTNAYFSETFGRGLDDYNESIRKNRLNLNRRWSYVNVNAETLWFDNVVNRRQNERDGTLQQLPVINVDHQRRQIFSLPAYYDVESEYVHFFREDGDTGHRLDFYPRFYLPLRLKNYLTFEPSLGVRETLWYRDRIENPSDDTDRFFNRELFDARADLFTELFNIFKVDLWGVDRIKHSVRPQVVYDYTHDVNQRKLPFFEDIDRIGKQSLLTYSLTNSLTSRFKKKKPQKKETDPPEASAETEEPADEYDYRQFFRFKLEQSYDINLAIDDNPQPFSLVDGRIDFVPFRYFAFEATGQWSQYEHEMVGHNMAVTLTDKRGDRLFVERRYSQASSESIYFDARLQLTDSISAYGFYEYNVLDDIRIQSGIGGSYTAQCWSLDLHYVDEQTDRRYEFTISLYGLGRIRRSVVGRTVESSIGGF